MADILLIAGLSGAGRSQAADDLEDVGWFVVDNLPISLIDKVVELADSTNANQQPLALVVGAAMQQTDAVGVVERLRQSGHRVRVLFMDAATPELVRRYVQTRRKHPLAQGEMSVEEAIVAERRMLESVKGASDVVIDVRFVPNPHWDENLRPLTGLDESVRDFVMSHRLSGEFLDQLLNMLDLLIPAYREEGKSYLSVAIGCTGGRHRSVAVAERLASELREGGHRPRVTHRDLHR